MGMRGGPARLLYRMRRRADRGVQACDEGGGLMESAEIFNAFMALNCAGCGGEKQRRNAFCLSCYRQLPKALQSCLWKRFGSGFEEAYQACLSWFREHPLQGEHRAKQSTLF